MTNAANIFNMLLDIKYNKSPIISYDETLEIITRFQNYIHNPDKFIINDDYVKYISTMEFNPYNVLKYYIASYNNTKNNLSFYDFVIYGSYHDDEYMCKKYKKYINLISNYFNSLHVKSVRSA